MSARSLACIGVLATGLGAALPGQAAEPRSAIPWLSESVETVGIQPPPAPPAPPALAPGDDGITVTALPGISRDAIGLLPPEQTGFARALWGPQTAEEVRDEILAAPATGVPEARAFFQRILLAEAAPPQDAGGETSVLLARLDRLLDMGALEKAEALVVAAGPVTPELFRRWFDIGLLLDRASEPCAALRQNPALSPTLPARVFCLARGGDWNAAEITLTLGEQLGQISGDEQALLARFLDPELFEDADPPAIPDPLTPLEFLMREAVGLPRPSGPLPNAFLLQDLNDRTPMRMRIEAAERLALSGAIDEGQLFDAYRSGEPAASGGVWDRAGAVQALDAALDANAGVEAALAGADAALSGRGLRVALAREYGDRLAALDPAGWTAPDRDRLATLLLLADRTDAATAAAGPDPAPRLAAALGLARGDGAPPDSERARFAAEGLTATEPKDDRERALAALVAAGRQGEALLQALALLADGPAVDPQALRAGLLTLRLAGQLPVARTVALQTLLSEPTP